LRASRASPYEPMLLAFVTSALAVLAPSGPTDSQPATHQPSGCPAPALMVQEAGSRATVSGGEPTTQRGGRGGATARTEADGTEAVRITADDKVVLAASYWAPTARGERAPGVLLLHDAGGSRADFGEMAELLRKRGFAVLSMDLRGHGESANERLDFAKSTDDEKKTLWALATRDVQAAATWLRTRPEVHSTNLNVIALGAGAGLAARQAGRDENVRSIVLLRPCADQLGLDLSADLRALEGLPTYIAAPSDVREKLSALLGPLETNEAVRINYVREPKGELLDERRLRTGIVDWVGEQALPKRGRS